MAERTDLQNAIPSRAAVIMAHPDDPEFSSGGTIARWTAAGAEVHLIVVTDGPKGTSDRTMAPERLAAIRMTEQRGAAKALGVEEVHFLGYVDGEVMANLALRHLITRQIRLLRPDTVITHDPARMYYDGYINHPDHRAVGEATLAAVYPTARDPLNVPEHLAEGLEPHAVKTVLLTGAVEPDVWIDIEATFGRKVVALAEHRSQIKDAAGLETRLRERHAAVAEGHGMHLAEAFKGISLP